MVPHLIRIGMAHAHPLPNAQMGVQLAQAGNKADALSYLRRAVQSEPVNAEVWLWLAHVTPDLQEYRHCVYQALAKEPNHTIARQMHDALVRIYPRLSASRPQPQISYVFPSESKPLVVDDALVSSVELQQRVRGRRRLLAIIAAFFILIGMATVIGLILTNQQQAKTSNQTTIRVLGANDTVWQFELEVPESWLLADSNSADWVAARERLAETWPDVDVWAQVETDINSVVVSETGSVTPQITLIETDPGAIPENPTRLQLRRIISVSDTTCEGMRQLAENRQAELQTDSVVSNQIVEQAPDRCIFVVHFEGFSGYTQMMEHIYVMQIPANEEAVAEWHLTVADAEHETYQEAIQQVIRTLRAKPD